MSKGMPRDFKFNPAQGGQPQNVQLNLSPRDLEDVVCEKCDNFTFQAVLLLKRVPSVVAPDGKEAFWPTQMFACHACGHINARFVAGVEWFSDEVLRGHGIEVPEPEPENPNVVKGSNLELENVDDES